MTCAVRYRPPVVQILGKNDQMSDNWELKAFFVIPKMISVIPYPYDYFVSYPSFLKPLTGPR